MAATTAAVKSLADELITTITGLTLQEDPDNFVLCRQFTLKNFKGHKFARTNQFDVNSKLEGLEEKFRVYNRDDIASALRSRLSRLPSNATGFIPELLSLFLALSDRPLENSHLDDLDALVPPEEAKGLTWADIIAEDPLVGEEWKNVDFGAESSDEWSDDGVSAAMMRDEIIEERKMEEEGRKKKWVGEDYDEDIGKGVEGFMVKEDKDGLEELKKGQYWERKVKPVDEEIDVSLGSGGVENISIISELQATREVLFMLLGYPCVLFKLGGKTSPSDKITVWVDTNTLTNRFALRHSSLPAFQSILGWYADHGTHLNRIRAFAKPSSPISPEQETFISAITTQLTILDYTLTKIEATFVTPDNTLVSLLSLQNTLTPLLHPYTHLSTILHTLTTPPPPPAATQATAHLSHLFTTATTAQSIGDIPTFTFMTTLFFTSLSTYLRPIRTWMEHGVLPPTHTHFLIAKTHTNSEVDLGFLWHNQYHLRRDDSGVLQAPPFVHRAAERIFVTGKSVVFLKRLVELPEDTGEVGDQELDFTAVCSGEEDTLAPFEDAFGKAFERWIDARHHSVSGRLREVLGRSCGLWKSLDAVGMVYLGRDGYLFESVASQVFEKVDKGIETWGDRFLLTEMIQGVLGGVGGVEARRLRMRGKLVGGGTLKEARKAVGMWKGVEVDYALPWPIMNVIRKDSFKVYKAIFTFLLQIRRSTYVLKRLSLLREDFRTMGGRGEGAMYYSLKHRMLWFANTIYYYLTDLVLLPQTEEMRIKMAAAVDVDGMIAVHNTYIKFIRDQCLLGPKLLSILTQIITLLDLSITFSDLHLARTASTRNAGDVSMRDISVVIAPRRRRHDSDSEDSEEDSESEEHGEDEGEEGLESYGGRMAAMSAKFNALLDFIKAGLRGVARAGVAPHLEALAEGLDGVGWERRYG